MVNYVILNEAMKNYKYTSGPSHRDLRVLPLEVVQCAASLPATRGVTNHYAAPASFAYKA
jgi:hypothetical protein